ncbi:endochitinase [Selaginella moellendorffii]|uniref:endochitinase n=1 Tax=Selaginella moellendorffii TaxID=88036 RepID=UPI000D1C3FF4|nr:endochitinase [Selaginella moellendorffii]|eukprot:XP_024519525.1 endochitinase [Selaginella moellendorffii]
MAFAKLSLALIFSLLLVLSSLVAANHCDCGGKRGGRAQGGHSHNTTSPSPPTIDIGALVSSDLFDQLLDNKKAVMGCAGSSFYTHASFMAAAKAFPAFGCTGSPEQRKTEIAAFFAQTSAQTAGGGLPGGLLSSGYCMVESHDKNRYCQQSEAWPCAPGKSYHGRGPLQLKWNFNYGACGRAVGFDGIINPEIVAKDPEVAFKSALWFWMTPQGNTPSCHDVILGVWKPSKVDISAGRTTGCYGTVTNIINGREECGQGPNAHGKVRVGFYKRLGVLLGVDTGPNVDCYNQKPWN